LFGEGLVTRFLPFGEAELAVAIPVGLTEVGVGALTHLLLPGLVVGRASRFGERDRRSQDAHHQHYGFVHDVFLFGGFQTRTHAWALG